MNTLSEIQTQIIDEFAFFSNWTEKYEHLIDMGNSLAPMKVENKIDDNLIKGCQSKVWLHASFNGKRVVYSADSDAIITKGIVGLMLRVFSNQTPKKIIAADISFIDKVELKEHLSPTRANGLMALVKQIKLYAVAYKASIENEI